MSGSSTIDIPRNVLDAVRKFRLKPSSHLTALVFKIDKATLTLGLEETLDSGLTSIQDLLEGKPEPPPNRAQSRSFLLTPWAWFGVQSCLRTRLDSWWSTTNSTIAMVAFPT